MNHIIPPLSLSIQFWFKVRVSNKYQLNSAKSYLPSSVEVEIHLKE